jgi:hypothetical protein
MRVSGRKLRIAVGTGIAALMLTVGVSSVGATAPGVIGNPGINVVVTGSQTSASGSSNVTTTVATYRDAVRVTNAGLNSNATFDNCFFFETGNNYNAANTSSTDITPGLSCGEGINLIIQPAAYPLWEVQTGIANPSIGGPGATRGTQVLVIPPTGVPANGTAPAKAYVIETFR